jgi:hypothetical protein
MYRSTSRDSRPGGRASRVISTRLHPPCRSLGRPSVPVVEQPDWVGPVAQLDRATDSCPQPGAHQGFPETPTCSSGPHRAARTIPRVDVCGLAAGAGSEPLHEMGAAGCASEALRVHLHNRSASRPAGSPPSALLSGPGGGQPLESGTVGGVPRAESLGQRPARVVSAGCNRGSRPADHPRLHSQPAICSTSPAAAPTQGDGRSNDPTKCKRADRLAARAGGAVDSEDARAAGSTSTTWRQPGRHRAGEAHAFYDVGTDNASQVPAHSSGRRTVPILHRSAPAVRRSAGYRRAA